MRRKREKNKCGFSELFQRRVRIFQYMGSRSVNDKNRRRLIHTKERRSRQLEAIRPSVGGKAKFLGVVFDDKTLICAEYRLRHRPLQIATEPDESDHRRNLGRIRDRIKDRIHSLIWSILDYGSLAFRLRDKPGERKIVRYSGSSAADLRRCDTGNEWRCTTE